MGFPTRIMTIMLPFILCCLHLSHGQDKCARTNKETVKDLLQLTERLFDGKTSLLVKNILPDGLRQKSIDRTEIKQRKERLAVVNKLLSIISQREIIMEMEEDNQAVRVLKVIFESVYNEACKNLQSENGVNCSDVSETKRVLLLLKLREQTIQNFGLLNMTKKTKLENETLESYITWRRIVDPNNENPKRITFPKPLARETCNRCSLGHC